MISHTHKECLSSFTAHLKTEEYSHNTAKKYRRDVAAFLNHLDQNQLTRERVLAYKKILIEKYTVTSANSMIAALNRFFRFLQRTELIVKLCRLQKQVFSSEERELTREEYLRLVKTARQMGKIRLALILETICACGIRISELPFITVEAIRHGSATVSLKRKTRTVLIPNALRSKLLDYCRAHKIQDGSIFLTQGKKAVDRSNVWREMKQISVLANVKPDKVFPHNLRHLFARTFYALDKDIAKLADLLGHTSINTTRLYVMTSNREHRRRIEHMRLIL